MGLLGVGLGWGAFYQYGMPLGKKSTGTSGAGPDVALELGFRIKMRIGVWLNAGRPGRSRVMARSSPSLS